MLSSKRHLALGLLVGLAGTGVTATASAQQTPQSTIILNTATTLAYHAPNRANPKPRQRDGAGAMDPSIAFDRQTLDVFAFFTRSVPWGNGTNLDTGMQAGMAITKLTSTGLAPVTVKLLPDQPNAQRVFQRTNVLLGKNFVAAVFADEKNGVDDGNPQPVIWIFDRQGNQLPVTNSGDTGQNNMDPINLYTLSGQNDGNQLCPHDVAQLPDEADGSQSWVVGLQYNNQKAKALKVNIKTDGSTGATVTVPYLTTLIQNAQHVRPVFALPHDGLVHNNQLVVTGVDANGQPRTNGVRAVLMDTTNGKVISSTLFPSDKTNKIYNVQPSISYISDSVVALEYQRSSPQDAKQFIVNRNDGHVAAPNLSHLTTLMVPTTPGADFTIVQEADRVALQNRHSASVGMLYGADGSEGGGVGVLSASSTGTGGGFMQVIPIDATGHFNATPDPMKAYAVATYADVAGLPAATLRDPGQGRGFFKGYHGLPNPSYRVSTGFMPEVKMFNISAVAGYADPTKDNMESLTFALVPTVWDPTYNTTPGQPTPNVPPGPSPTAPQGTPTTNPSGPSAGTGVGGQGSTGSSGGGGGGGSVTGGGSGGGGVHAPGYGNGMSAGNGCGCTTAGSDQSSDLAGFAALGLGFAVMGLRRRNGKKES